MLEVSFTPDRRVTQFSSTAIPDTERIGRALAGIRPVVTADNATAGLAGRNVNLTSAAGEQQTLHRAASGELQARELSSFRCVAPTTCRRSNFISRGKSCGRQDDSAPRVYVDAVTGDLLGAAPAPPAPGTLSAIFA